MNFHTHKLKNSRIRGLIFNLLYNPSSLGRTKKRMTQILTEVMSVNYKTHKINFWNNPRDNNCPVIENGAIQFSKNLCEKNSEIIIYGSRQLRYRIFSDSPSSPFITGATSFQKLDVQPKKPNTRGHSGLQNEPIVFNLGLTSSFPIQNRKFIPIICRKLQV